MLHLKSLKKSHKFSQVTQLALALILTFFMLQLWQASLLQSEVLLEKQSKGMSEMLLSNVAYGASSAIRNKQSEQLKWLVTNITQDPRVISAAIYNAKGSKVAYAQSLSNQTPINNKNLKQQLKTFPPFIKNIRINGENIGYVELRLDESAFLTELRKNIKNNAEQQQLMLLIAGFIGMLASRALSFKRAAYQRLKQNSD